MNRLTDKHFSFKCPMNWDSMQPSDNGRFCGKCRKDVFDPDSSTSSYASSE
ncbi:MAG: hypothetical protein V4727_06785 [Verrucomicrobiota bacterium]